MSKYHKKDCPKKRSCWCGILVLLGGLLLLGIALALIFGFKEKERDQQPNSTFYPFGEETLVLTPDDDEFVVYENVEPQPILVSFYDVFAVPPPTAKKSIPACELQVTFETENKPPIIRTLKAENSNPLNQITTLVGKEATKVTVEATSFTDTLACEVTIFGTNGTNFSSFP